MDTLQDTEIFKKAIRTAEKWQNRANELLTAEEKAIQEQMLRLLTHPMDKVVLTKLIDQSFRSNDHRRVADQVNAILQSHGVPVFFLKWKSCWSKCFWEWDATCRHCRFRR